MAEYLPLCIQGGLPGGAMPDLDLERRVGRNQPKRSRAGGAEECSRQNTVIGSGVCKTAIHGVNVTQGRMDGGQRQRWGHRRF